MKRINNLVLTLVLTCGVCLVWQGMYEIYKFDNCNYAIVLLTMVAGLSMLFFYTGLMTYWIRRHEIDQLKKESEERKAEIFQLKEKLYS